MGAVYLKQHYDKKLNEMADKEVAHSLEKVHK